MKKIILYGISSVFAAATLVLVGYIYFQNATYKNYAMAEASKLTGTPVECTGFTYNPFTKTLSIRNLRLGNPKKYNTLYTVQVSKVLIQFKEVDIQNRQFLIDGIKFNDTFFNYEMDGLIESNLHDLILHIQEVPTGSSARLRIEALDFNNINVSLNSIRYKREVGNLDAPGFALKHPGGGEGMNIKDFSLVVLRALLMHAADTVNKNSTIKMDPQFRRAASEILTVMVKEQPELARELKL
jgi:hypothetical protein